MELTLNLYLISLLVIFIAIYTRTLTGLGGALITVTVLSIFLPFKFVVGLDTLLETIVLAFMVRFLYKNTNFKEIFPLVIGGVVGTFIGLLFLQNIDEVFLKHVLGFVILISVVFLVIEQKKHLRFSKKLGYLFGFIGGTFGSVVSSTAPSFAVYLSGRINKKDTLRASILTLVFIVSLFRTVAFTVSGVINVQTVEWVILLLPGVAFSMYLSNKTSHIISVTFLKQAIITIVFLLGLGLVFV